MHDKTSFTVEYERLNEIKELTNTIEHKEIYNIIQERKNTPKSDYISMDDMAQKLDMKVYKKADE